MPKKILQQHQIQQSSLLLVSTVIGMGFGFLNSILVARLLGVSDYGDYKFIQTVWFFLSLISSFGLFHAASRVIVLEPDPKTIAEVTGASFLIACGISLLMMLASILLAKPIDLLFETHLASLFIALSPLLFAYSLQGILPLVLQAANRIALLAIFVALPQMINLAILFAMQYMNFASIVWVSIAQLGPILLVGLFVFWRLNPAFRNLLTSFKKIFEKNKSYGSDIYKGSIGSVGASQINRLAVAYWVDSAALGVLSLAIILTEPLKLLPNVVATSSFRKFSEQNQISKRMLQASVLVSILFWVMALLFYNNFLHLLYPQGFESVKWMAIALSLGAILHGFGDFYNRFLGAHGQGKSIRNSAYIVGLINIVGALAFLPLFGLRGAVLAILVGNFSYFFLMFFSYNKFHQKRVGNDEK